MDRSRRNPTRPGRSGRAEPGARSPGRRTLTQGIRRRRPASGTGSEGAEPASAESAAEPRAEEEDGAPRPSEETAEGLANYQASLGNWLGEKLYRAVAPHLTLDSLSGYATQGLEAALAELAGQLRHADGEASEQALSRFGEALADEYGSLAGEWVEGDGAELAEALADWADANPRLVALVGLLAAGAAIAADMDLPTFSQKLSLAEGLEASGSVDLGSLRNLALKEIEAKLSYQSGPVRAAIEVSRDEEGEIGGGASLRVGDDRRYLEVEGQLEEDGLTLFGVPGLELGYEIEAVITREDGSVLHTRGLRFDGQSGTLTVSDRFALGLEGGGELTAEGRTGSDGSEAFELGLTRPLGDDLQAEAGLLAQRQGELESGQLELALRYRDEAWSDWLAEETPDGGLSAGAYARAGWGERAGFEGRANLSWQDTRTHLRGSYGYRSPEEQHRLELLAQHRLSDRWAIRAGAGLTAGEEGVRTEGSLHTGYAFTPQLAGIAGGRYQRDEQDRSTFIPEVGVQLRGVPLTVGYDTRNRRVTIGITFNPKFGSGR